MRAPVFTVVQRRELARRGVTEAQTLLLQECLPTLRPFVSDRPSAPDVRAPLEAMLRIKRDEVKRLKAMLASRTPAGVEAMERLAYYMERDPKLGRELIEQERHPVARGVMLRALDEAQRMEIAARLAIAGVKGQKGHSVSIAPIAHIHGALLRGQVCGVPVIPVSSSPGSAFASIVSICMEAAGGAVGRGYDRALREYKESLGRADERHGQ